MQEKFTKEDLKVGMLVEHKNRKLRLVIAYGENDNLKLIGKDKFYGELEFHNNDLTNSYNEEFDIIKVYSRSKNFNTYLNFTTEGRELLWERKEEPEYMTFWDAIKCKYMKHKNAKEYEAISLYDKENIFIPLSCIKELDKKVWLGTNKI